MKNKKKGFTLVELIVVLAILAILAAMLVPALTGYIDKANEKKVMAAARQYGVAAQSVVSDAYATNDIVNELTIYDNQTTKVTLTSGSGDVTKLAASFKSLAEPAKNDYAVFTVTDSKISGYVVSNGKEATLANGEWSVSSTVTHTTAPTKS